MNVRLKYLLLTILSSCAIRSTYAQVDKSRVLAAYINNFSRYITWPEENAIDTFRIALYTDNAGIIKEFREFSHRRRIKERPVALILNKPFQSLGKVQIVMLMSERSNTLPEVYNMIEGKPVLLVSEEYKDKRSVMINLYKTPQDQLLFEVNKSNLINQHLSIDPEILLAGGTEIDVASLYRSSQLSLRAMQKNMDKLGDSLQKIQQNIQGSAYLINKQQREIDIQKEMLAQTRSQLDTHEKVIRSQNLFLSIQKDSIDRKNQVLNDQFDEIRKKRLEAENLSKTAQAKQKQIEDLNVEISRENIIRDLQSRTIFRQKRFLSLIIVIGVLSVFLAGAIFLGYRSNRRKSNRLAAQNKEIEERLDELKELNLKLQLADQYKSIFLASMSHELRTPLNSIIGYTGILLMGMTGDLNEEQIKQLNKVKNNARHLLSLINDILDISKIEAEKVELDLQQLNIKDLVNEVVETIYPKASEKQLLVTASVPGDLTVVTDIRRIKQILLNLAGNAVNYSDSGSIHIKAERLDGEKYSVSVKDTGIGIPENELSRLFQPFQQIDSSMTKKNKGTGLGLYLSRKLANLLQGEIFVKSKPGEGSEFYIEMPVNTNKS